MSAPIINGLRKWPNFWLSMACDLTLDRVMLHTFVHHSSTATYIPNFIEIGETFCGRMDVRTFETHFIRSTRRSLSKGGWKKYQKGPILRQMGRKNLNSANVKYKTVISVRPTDNPSQCSSQNQPTTRAETDNAMFTCMVVGYVFNKSWARVSRNDQHLISFSKLTSTEKFFSCCCRSVAPSPIRYLNSVSTNTSRHNYIQDIYTSALHPWLTFCLWYGHICAERGR